MYFEVLITKVVYNYMWISQISRVKEYKAVVHL